METSEKNKQTVEWRCVNNATPLSVRWRKNEIYPRAMALLHKREEEREKQRRAAAAELTKKETKKQSKKTKHSSGNVRQTRRHRAMIKSLIKHSQSATIKVIRRQLNQS